MQEGDQSFLSLCSTRQNGRNRKAWEEGPLDPRCLPMCHFPALVAHFQVTFCYFFADMLFLGAFAPISFSSLQVTNFMNIQPTLKCKISNHLFEWRRIWLIAELSNQVNFPGYISVWTRPWYRHSFSSVRAKKRGKPRIHLRTCSILYNRWKNTSNIWTYILTVQENTTDLFAFPQISFYKLPFSNTFIPNL